MPQLINWDLMKNPLNWINVFFMVLLPLIALALISEKFRH